jgi:hypothetical protein
MSKNASLIQAVYLVRRSVLSLSLVTPNKPDGPNKPDPRQRREICSEKLESFN